MAPRRASRSVLQDCRDLILATRGHALVWDDRCVGPNPAPTANANKPSPTAPASSAISTVTVVRLVDAEHATCRSPCRLVREGEPQPAQPTTGTTTRANG
jgi:hypothetical protein